MITAIDVKIVFKNIIIFWYTKLILIIAIKKFLQSYFPHSFKIIIKSHILLKFETLNHL